jgi:hypothetical protein
MSNHTGTQTSSSLRAIPIFLHSLPPAHQILEHPQYTKSLYSLYSSDTYSDDFTLGSITEVPPARVLSWRRRKAAPLRLVSIGARFDSAQRNN